jgi:hypothetical protein
VGADHHQVQVAIQVLAEHLSRSVSDDVTEAAGLKARGRGDELQAIAEVLARTVDAYDGPPAREVLQAAQTPAELIEALDRG